MRAIFEAVGVQDVVASLSAHPAHNMIKATFDALKNIQAPRAVAVGREQFLAH